MEKTTRTIVIITFAWICFACFLYARIFMHRFLHEFFAWILLHGLLHGFLRGFVASYFFARFFCEDFCTFFCKDFLHGFLQMIFAQISWGIRNDLRGSTKISPRNLLKILHSGGLQPRFLKARSKSCQAKECRKTEA